MLRHFFYSPHMTVPDTIVKQIAEGRPVVLALLCNGLRTHYLPIADDLPREAFQVSQIAAPSARGVAPALIEIETPDFETTVISCRQPSANGFASELSVP